MTSSKFGRFLLTLLVFAAPLWALLLFYVIADPFQVIKSYSSYFPPEGPITGVCTDYITTQTFLNHYQKNNYNAYILGSSRAGFYHVDDWKKHIGNQNCYHMSASAENIYGIEKKLELIDRLGCRIDYALIILDSVTLRNIGSSQEHIFIKHPALTGQNRLSFQWVFLQAFLDARFTIPYLKGIAKGLWDKTDTGAGKNPQTVPRIKYAVNENEQNPYYFDSIIQYNPQAYYATRLPDFPNRPAVQQVSAHVIFDYQEPYLQGIKQILNKHKTNYKIIISPAYNQVKMNEQDLTHLKSLFGAENVFDFSGINKWTADYHNFYDPVHYIPKVAAELMDSAYANGKIDSLNR